MLHRPFNASVPLWDDEPAYALAKRLARRNGVRSLQSFASDHGLPRNEIVDGRRNAEIAVFAGAEVAKLDAVTFRCDDDERVRLNGEVLHRDDWSYTSLRVCPACLKGDLERQDSRVDFLPHIRSWWNVVRISVCPLHGVALMESDPADPSMKIDHESLDVRYAAGSQCDLAMTAATHVDDVRAEAYLLGRLGFMPRVVSTILDGLPLWNAIRVMDRIGAVAAAGVRSFTSFGGEVGVREALVVGYEVIAGGRESFFRFLDDLVASADIQQGKWGPRVVYGRVYEWLSHDTRSDAYDPIRELVREHAMDKIPLGPEDLLFGRPFGERRVYTLWHASKAMGVVPTAARRILRALGHLDDTSEGKQNWQIALKSSVIEKVSGELRDAITLNQARDHLALPRAPMAALCDAGLLKPFLHLSTGVKEHVFRVRDLDDFVGGLLSDAPELHDAGDLCDVVLAGKRAQTSTLEIVSALIDGRLHCAGRLKGAAGMMRILVDLERVKELRDTGAVLDEGRSVEAARETLGLTWEVIGKLIRFGHLDVTSANTGLRNRSRMLIAPETLAEFSKTYVTATEIAAERRTHVRTLVQSLRREGIEPAIGKDEVGQYFYRRDDLANRRPAA